MRRFKGILGPLAVVVSSATWAACSPADDQLGGRPWWADDANAADGGGVPRPPGGTLEDEQFPADLLKPYTGPPIDVYDNTGVGYMQLKARIQAVFNDTGIGGDTNKYFESKIGLLGGADFVQHFTEARVISSDFLLALDAVAKDACARAAQNKTGPFAGSDPQAATGAAADALVTQLYQKMLFRSAAPDEITAGKGLVDELGADKTSAWAGLCEALVRHPDAIFTLPPSAAIVTGPEKDRLRTVKLAVDLLGRPPNDAEFAALAGKSIDEQVDALMAKPEFRDFFFHRVRVRMESIGTPESDEPARLWAYLVVNGLPMQDILMADYTVDEQFQKKDRPPYHGKTGVLTMPGFIKSKPGLPHYNYSARVMTDFMGQLFEVTPDIVNMRATATAESTVTPGTTCVACHGVLTPLAYQRLRWADDGTYREKDEKGQTIEDTDRGVVPGYPYKGRGMQDFAVQAVKKEKFFRQSFQALYLFFLGRHMRYAEDERTVYLDLWNKAYATNGNTKELIKVIAKLPTYLGK